MIKDSNTRVIATISKESKKKMEKIRKELGMSKSEYIEFLIRKA